MMLFPDIVGELNIGDHNIKYGSWNDEGYVVVVNSLTEEFLFESNYQLGNRTEFIYIADVGDDQLIVLALVDEIESWLLQLDMSGQMMGQKLLDDIPDDFYNHQHSLILEFQHQSDVYKAGLVLINDIDDVIEVSSYACQSQGYILLDGVSVSDCMLEEPGIYSVVYQEKGSQFQYRVLIRDEIKFIGSRTEKGYEKSVRILTYGEIYVNGLLYQEEVLINQPGEYQVRVYYHDYLVYEENITVLPWVTYYNGKDVFDLFNDAIMNESISIYSSATKMILNGEDYLGTTIFLTGDYELLLYVENDLIDKRVFSIEPKVRGVNHHQVYQQVSFYAFGDVYLNQEKINGHQIIDKPGNYVIEVYMKDKLIDRIFFVIDNQNNDHSIDLLAEILLLVLILYGALKFLKK